MVMFIFTRAYRAHTHTQYINCVNLHAYIYIYIYICTYEYTTPSLLSLYKGVPEFLDLAHLAVEVGFGDASLSLWSCAAQIVSSEGKEGKSSKGSLRATYRRAQNLKQKFTGSLDLPYHFLLQAALPANLLALLARGPEPLAKPKAPAPGLRKLVMGLATSEHWRCGLLMEV